MADSKDKKNGGDSLEEPSTIIEPTEKPKDDNVQVAEEESLTSADSSSFSPDKQPNSSSFFGKVKRFANLYFLIFIIILLVAGIVIIISIKVSNKNAGTQTTKTQSLTDQQIAALKGSTTLVGDPQKVLDIQGSSIFEGQVLLRNNLDVAGSIKVGGSLSLPAITVGGTSSFGQILVNDKLSVNGDTLLQGQLTVQKGLTVAGTASFGTLSASKLNVSTIQLTGDLVISRHLGISGGTPSRTNGSALGSGGTASVNGTDTSGTVTINTGGGPPAGCFVTIGFTQKFNTTPHVVISPSNSSASSLDFYTNRSNTNFSVCASNAPSASTTYLFDYIVVD
jgi:cytoskeletal protein CcmA (bactofilin family)